ncbi:MAG: trypsin-like peptidase domain-containing protein [Planctomycetes bacterium]|nr:trypsin-like peptidase domain-containing protein [Planctomycetota bacterium]
MKRLVLVALLAFALAGASALPACADESGDQLTALVEKYAPTIVTVKLVLKTELSMGGQSRDNESRIDRHGVVVDAGGLVMLPSAGLAGDSGGDLAGGGGDVQLKITATDIKVIIGREDKEYGAFLAATDSKVGLAFLQLEDLADRKLTAIDFGTSADTSMGQWVAAVARQTKGYDYAPYFETARVSGDIEKPRKAWMVDGRLGGVGLPVFKLTGQVVGVLTMIPDTTRLEEARASRGGGGRGGGRGFGGLAAGLRGGGGGEFILPGSVAKGLIAKAKEKAVEVGAERAKQKTEKKADAEGKDADDAEAGK